MTTTRVLSQTNTAVLASTPQVLVHLSQTEKKPHWLWLSAALNKCLIMMK